MQCLPPPFVRHVQPGLVLPQSPRTIVTRRVSAATSAVFSTIAHPTVAHMPSQNKPATVATNARLIAADAKVWPVSVAYPEVMQCGEPRPPQCQLPPTAVKVESNPCRVLKERSPERTFHQQPPPPAGGPESPGVHVENPVRTCPQKQTVCMPSAASDGQQRAGSCSIAVAGEERKDGGGIADWESCGHEFQISEAQVLASLKRAADELAEEFAAEWGTFESRLTSKSSVGSVSQQSAASSYFSPKPVTRQISGPPWRCPTTTPSTSAGTSVSPIPSPRESPRTSLRRLESSAGLPPFPRKLAPSSPAPRKRSVSPGIGERVSAHSLRRLCCGGLDDEAVHAFVEDLFFESLPRENVVDLKVEQLGNERLRSRFLQSLRDDGNRWCRVRVAWHFPGGAFAVSAIRKDGISCAEDHCACGRYGRGGYVALSAAKANAYADSDGEGGIRRLFLVLALPDEDVVQGRKGTRPERTAADLCSHPTEYCFVDEARLHCVCLLTYRWVPTGRREKVTTAGTRASHFAPRRRSRPTTPQRDMPDSRLNHCGKTQGLKPQHGPASCVRLLSPR